LIGSTPLFAYFAKYGYDRVVKLKEDSYQIENRNETVEQFEKLEINALIVDRSKIIYDGVVNSKVLLFILAALIVLLLGNFIFG